MKQRSGLDVVFADSRHAYVAGAGSDRDYTLNSDEPLCQGLISITQEVLRILLRQRSHRRGKNPGAHATQPATHSRGVSYA